MIEPATEAVLAEVPRAGVAEVDAAVQRASDALPGWRALAPAARAQTLHALADVLAEHHEELAQLEARNAGKAICDARGEMGMVIDVFRYFAGAPERPYGDSIPVAGGQAFTVREPLGVVGLITPWNFPLTIASWKLAPALAAGNTVVLKPAELTPLTALRFEQLALERGCRRAWSTSWWARAAHADSASWSTRWCRRSRSRGRPRSGARSRRAQQRRSSA